MRPSSKRRKPDEPSLGFHLRYVSPSRCRTLFRALAPSGRLLPTARLLKNSKHQRNMKTRNQEHKVGSNHSAEQLSCQRLVPVMGPRELRCNDARSRTAASRTVVNVSEAGPRHKDTGIGHLLRLARVEVGVEQLRGLGQLLASTAPARRRYSADIAKSSPKRTLNPTRELRWRGWRGAKNGPRLRGHRELGVTQG